MIIPLSYFNNYFRKKNISVIELYLILKKERLSTQTDRM